MPCLVTRDAGVGVITLNRLKSLNAMNEPLMDLLRDAIVELGEDDAIRCVVLRGNGQALSAGGDVAMMTAPQEAACLGQPLSASIEREQRNLIRRGEASALLRKIAKPTVAVLHLEDE
jgi:enoyl-CoA hydratase/carnithine racemase